MLNPTQETARQNDDEVMITAASEDEHVSPDRSVIGPYNVEMPDPRD
jgi:hypothetical protein